MGAPSADSLPIQPLDRVPSLVLNDLPGSKSITNRALVLAVLAGRHNRCWLWHALGSEDTEVMSAALLALGFRVDWRSAGTCMDWGVGVGKKAKRIIPARQADLFVGNSGTTMRFLTGLGGLG